MDISRDTELQRLPLGCQTKAPRPVIAGQWLEINEYRLFPLDLSSSIAPSFQLHPVFGIAAERVPPNDAAARRSGFGDRSWDSFKNSS